jgi:hypothetical protein
MEIVANRAAIVVECITPGIGNEVYRTVRDCGFGAPVIFSSFLHEEMLTRKSLQKKASLNFHGVQFA